MYTLRETTTRDVVMESDSLEDLRAMLTLPEYEDCYIQFSEQAIEDYTETEELQDKLSLARDNWQRIEQKMEELVK